MALRRSNAGVGLSAETEPARIALFSAANSRRAPAGIREVTDLLDPRRNDELRITSAEQMSHDKDRRPICLVTQHISFVAHSLSKFRYSGCLRLQAPPS